MVLKKLKHELFAQGIAKGNPACKAYKLAGYKTADGNASVAAASRLLSDVNVRARVDELREAVAEVVIEKTGINRATLLEELGKLVLAPLGDEIVQANVKRAAIVDYAKIEGYVVERHEIAGNIFVARIPDKASTSQEWQKQHAPSKS